MKNVRTDEDERRAHLKSKGPPSQTASLLIHSILTSGCSTWWRRMLATRNARRYAPSASRYIARMEEKRMVAAREEGAAKARTPGQAAPPASAPWSAPGPCCGGQRWGRGVGGHVVKKVMRCKGFKGFRAGSAADVVPARLHAPHTHPNHPKPWLRCLPRFATAPRQATRICDSHCEVEHHAVRVRRHVAVADGGGGVDREPERVGELVDEGDAAARLGHVQQGVEDVLRGGGRGNQSLLKNWQRDERRTLDRERAAQFIDAAQWLMKTRRADA